MALPRYRERRRTGRIRRGLRSLWGAAADPASWRRALLLAALREGRADPFAVEPDGGTVFVPPAAAHRPASRSEA